MLDRCGLGTFRNTLALATLASCFLQTLSFTQKCQFNCQSCERYTVQLRQPLHATSSKNLDQPPSKDGWSSYLSLHLRFTDPLWHPF